MKTLTMRKGGNTKLLVLVLAVLLAIIYAVTATPLNHEVDPSSFEDAAGHLLRALENDNRDPDPPLVRCPCKDNRRVLRRVWYNCRCSKCRRKHGVRKCMDLCRSCWWRECEPWAEFVLGNAIYWIHEFSSKALVEESKLKEIYECNIHRILFYCYCAPFTTAWDRCFMEKETSHQEAADTGFM